MGEGLLCFQPSGRALQDCKGGTEGGRRDRDGGRDRDGRTDGRTDGMREEERNRTFLGFVFRIEGFGFRVSFRFGFRVQGSGVRVGVRGEALGRILAGEADGLLRLLRIHLWRSGSSVQFSGSGFMV